MKHRISRGPSWWGWALGWALLALGGGNLSGMIRPAQEAKATVESLLTEAPTLASDLVTALPAEAATVDASAATAVASPGAATPTSAATVDPQGSFIAPGDAESIRTYRLRWEMQFALDDQDETLSLLTLEHTVHKDQNAEHGKVVPQDQEALEWIRIGDQTWIRISAQDWVVFDASNQETLWVSLDEWEMPLADASDWQPVGEETIHGMPTVHYRVSAPRERYAPTVENFWVEAALSAQYDVQVSGDMQGDVWLTPEKVPLRYEVVVPLTARDDEGVEHPARWVWHYEVSDVNAAIEIQPPTPGGEAAPVPVPPDETLTLAQPAEGVWIYTLSHTDLAALIAFYRQQAEAGAITLQDELGGPGEGFWQVTAVLPNGDAFILSASEQSGEVMLMISR